MQNLILATALVAVAGVAGGVAVAHRRDDRIERRNKAIVAERFDAWRQGTGSPYELLTDDATWTIEGHSAAAGTYRGRDAFMQGVIRPFNARMRERLKPEVRAIYADGNTVVVHFDAEGMARDSIPYRNSYAWILRLRDGRVTEAWAFFDALMFDALWTRVRVE